MLSEGEIAAMRAEIKDEVDRAAQEATRIRRLRSDVAFPSNAEDAKGLIKPGGGPCWEGRDVTIVTWGATVYHAMELACQMAAEGRSLEILDLRTLIPLDEELIYRSIRKTNRVVICHEDSLTMGFGAEIAARISEHSIDALDAPVIRVAAKDSFVPNAPNLESAVLPNVDDLRNRYHPLPISAKQHQRRQTS